MENTWSRGSTKNRPRHWHPWVVLVEGFWLKVYMVGGLPSLHGRYTTTKIIMEVKYHHLLDSGEQLPFQTGHTIRVTRIVPGRALLFSMSPLIMAPLTV